MLVAEIKVRSIERRNEEAMKADKVKGYRQQMLKRARTSFRNRESILGKALFDHDMKRCKRATRKVQNTPILLTEKLEQ